MVVSAAATAAASSHTHMPCHTYIVVAMCVSRSERNVLYNVGYRISTHRRFYLNCTHRIDRSQRFSISFFCCFFWKITNERPTELSRTFQWERKFDGWDDKYGQNIRIRKHIERGSVALALSFSGTNTDCLLRYRADLPRHVQNWWHERDGDTTTLHISKSRRKKKKQAKTQRTRIAMCVAFVASKMCVCIVSHDSRVIRILSRMG